MACGAISNASKRQATVAASFSEAEYMVAAFAGKETIWLRQLLHELEQQYIDPNELSAPPAAVMYGENTGENTGENSLT